ncbi:MAG: hypothetical protein H7A18_09200 [Sinobacteraceae bacterium]|nr:hypothetical protein [Nevskiaceae bacterium]MCP5359947.1 hypothetical protein [Nevskiaceae bacterium]MCP5472234.1 hypothetical protein [Nevskiaceae bacterium]
MKISDVSRMDAAATVIAEAESAPGNGRDGGRTNDRPYVRAIGTRCGCRTRGDEGGGCYDQGVGLPRAVEATG